MTDSIYSVTALPFGIDTSRHNGQTDFDRVAQVNYLGQPVKFIGIRATVSWAYKDPEFPRSWRLAKEIGLDRTAYHVIYPKEDPIRQLEHFLSYIGAQGSSYGELPPVIDVELDHGQSARQYRDNLSTMIAYIKSQLGVFPIIYSRARFVDDMISGRLEAGNEDAMIFSGWYNDVWWWLAQYLASGYEFPRFPDIPKGVDKSRALFIQTSQYSGMAEGGGQFFGSGSSRMDLNRQLVKEPVYQAIRSTMVLEDSEPETPPENETEPETEPTDLTEIKEEIKALKTVVTALGERVDVLASRYEVVVEDLGGVTNVLAEITENLISHSSSISKIEAVMKAVKTISETLSEVMNG